MKYDLYILAGQSNMNGHGRIEDLPAGLQDIQRDVWIYNPNRRDDQQPIEDIGRWEELRPGHGAGFQADEKQNVHSNLFGPELSFAKYLKQNDPKKKIALFKYAKGGASIDPEAGSEWGCWDPEYNLGNGINQWTHFKHHLHRAEKIKPDSIDRFKPAGILWHQGESDASHSVEIAERYLQNLKNVIGKIRKELNAPELPCIIGQISDSDNSEHNENPVLPHCDKIQRAQRKFVKEDSHARLVKPPEDHGWTDPWHYDSETYIELGRRFAKAILQFEI